MERVQRLVSFFHSRKGIVPLDEETLIQFALQQADAKGPLVEDIEAYFEIALCNFKDTLVKPEKKVISRNMLSLEPSRDLTSDERVLYNFFTDYCTRNNIKGKWIADWEHVNAQCDEKTKYLIDEYRQGKVGTVPFRNFVLGGDRVLTDFRMYSDLEEKLRWDKFFCPGISSEDLLRILVSRHKSNEMNDQKVRNAVTPTQRRGPLSRRNLHQVTETYPEKGSGGSVSKLKMISDDLGEKIASLKTIRAKCKISNGIDPTHPNVYKVHFFGYKSFVVRSLDFDFDQTADSCGAQFCVVNDTREVRLGPVNVEPKVTLHGSMFCENFFSVVFSQKFSAHFVSLHAEIQANSVPRVEQRSRRIRTSRPMRLIEAKPTIVAHNKARSPPFSALQSRRKSQESQKLQGSDILNIVEATNSFVKADVPEYARESPQRCSYTTSATEISCIAEMFHNSVSRPRVCVDWLESGDCPIGNMCPYSHP